LYDIKYRNTKQHSNADCLSRLPQNSEELKKISSFLAVDDPITVFHLNQLRVLPLRAGEIASETKKDFEFKLLKKALQGPGKSKEDKTFFGLPVTEFGLENGCIMRGHRVVTPHSCRGTILKDLHEGHCGSCKMKVFARNYVW